MNNDEYLNNNDNIDNIFKKSSTTTFSELKNCLISIDTSEILKNLNTIDDFNLYHLVNLKKISYKNYIYGIVHIQLKYFQKKRNYDFFINYLDKMIEDALNISKTNSGKNKLFVLLDFSNISQKNYSRKFIRLLANKFNNKYEDCMALCYVYGNIKFIKILWPFINTLIDTTTKKKLVLLN